MTTFVSRIKVISFTVEQQPRSRLALAEIKVELCVSVGSDAPPPFLNPLYLFIHFFVTRLLLVCRSVHPVQRHPVPPSW